MGVMSERRAKGSALVWRAAAAAADATVLTTRPPCMAEAAFLTEATQAKTCSFMATHHTRELQHCTPSAAPGTTTTCRRERRPP